MFLIVFGPLSLLKNIIGTRGQNSCIHGEKEEGILICFLAIFLILICHILTEHEHLNNYLIDVSMAMLVYFPVLWYNIHYIHNGKSVEKSTYLIVLCLTLIIPVSWIASLMHKNEMRFIIPSRIKAMLTFLVCATTFIYMSYLDAEGKPDIGTFGCVWDDVVMAMNGGLFCDILTILLPQTLSAESGPMYCVPCGACVGLGLAKLFRMINGDSGPISSFHDIYSSGLLLGSLVGLMISFGTYHPILTYISGFQMFLLVPYLFCALGY